MILSKTFDDIANFQYLKSCEYCRRKTAKWENGIPRRLFLKQMYGIIAITINNGPSRTQTFFVAKSNENWRMKKHSFENGTGHPQLDVYIPKYKSDFE